MCVRERKARNAGAVLMAVFFTMHTHKTLQYVLARYPRFFNFSETLFTAFLFLVPTAFFLYLAHTQIFTYSLILSWELGKMAKYMC